MGNADGMIVRLPQFGQENFFHCEELDRFDVRNQQEPARARIVTLGGKLVNSGRSG